MSCPGTRGSLGLDRLVGRTSVSRSRAVDVIYLLMRRQTAHPGRSWCKGYRSFQLCKNWEGKGRTVARVLLPRSSPHYIKVDEKAGICITTYVFGGIAVTHLFSDTVLWCLPPVLVVCFLTHHLNSLMRSRELVGSPFPVPLRVRKRVSHL